MSNQKINCTVEACVHNDCKCQKCALDSITVVNEAGAPTAHLCKQYKKSL